ncbi:unnamed protein product [Schistocephalus solidus]|uniref:Required for meiotic nuclear division protein 1 homolog n=1 Tax=Schistocephalus solidus TaxID=70667 RepID=A0A183SCB5_SCHSO|nr:unnamed protein product [Schistocephalus solidus]
MTCMSLSLSAVARILCSLLKSLPFEQLPQSLLRTPDCGLQLKQCKWAVWSWQAKRTRGSIRNLFSTLLRTVDHLLHLPNLPAPVTGYPSLLDSFRGFTYKASNFGWDRRFDDLCRGHCGQRETLFHIQQCCQLTHRAHVLRHNQVMKFLATMLVKRGHEVLLEPHIPEGQTFRKPDIVVCGEDGLTVVHIGVTGEELMNLVHAEKINFY